MPHQGLKNPKTARNLKKRIESRLGRFCVMPVAVKLNLKKRI